MAERRRNLKWLWCGIFGVLLIGIIIAVIVISVNNSGSNEDNEQAKEETVTEQVSDTKEKTEEKPTAEKEEQKQYEGEDPNELETLTGVISYAGVSGGDLIVRVNIDQYLGNGSCEMNLTKNGTVVRTEEVAIINSVATSTCDGFKISAGELGTGKFAIEITLESDGKYGRMTGEVEI